MVLGPSEDATHLTAKLFRGFADPTRLRILQTLRAGPLSVGAIVVATGLGQSNVSNHLACLRDCGLVVCERRGRSVIYRTADPRVEHLLSLGEELLADVAHGVYACTRYEVNEREQRAKRERREGAPTS